MYDQLIWIVLAGMLVWIGVVIYLWQSDAGDGKRKSVAAFMVLGFFYPLLKRDSLRALSRRELFGWMIVLTMMCIAVILSVFRVI